MAKYKEIYVISSHTKNIFANMRRQGQGFSRHVTPLFETIMVNVQEEVGEGSGIYTDSHHTPTDTQPSSSKPQKKIKPKRKQRQAAKVHSPSSEIPVEECIPTPSNDPLPSGKDNIQLNELMIFCTSLQQQVLDLEKATIAQAKDIANLKKRVKNLEKRRKSRVVGMRRLNKVGTSKQVQSSEEKDSLGAQKDASKQGRNIKDINQDAEIAFVDEAQERMHDAKMFGVDDLEGNEVFVDVREKSVKKEVSTADSVTTAGEVVIAANVEDSVALTTATTADVDDELTLANTLIAIKDKGKAKMIKPDNPLKKKDQNALDEEVARKLEAKIRAKIEEEERIAREKDKLTEQIQAQEREHLSIEERSKLLAELIESRRKYFAAKRAEEIRNTHKGTAKKSYAYLHEKYRRI
uniref:Uncharacterized protein n=1 Tax=Tanacetum cinerariifolium TaxID=118510 RepID=A0A699LCV2_TANCI|nr:hypothetical protein [Tanacetum cinerariifolium]